MIKKNFGNIVKSFLSESTEVMRLKLQNHFITLEKEFDKNISRQNYYVKEERKRTLSTPVGDITIRRKIYINRHTHEHQILFDEHYGLDPEV